MLFRSSAYASGQEHERGTIAPGMLADLAVLGDDPVEVDPEAIGTIPVLATWVGGQEVWRS